MSTELRSAFHEDLESVRQAIVRMGGRVTEAIPRGTEAFLDNDLRAAQLIIDDDDILDQLALETEERIYGIIALQSPVASDLRAVTAALWMTAEIERSGDLVVNIAKATRRIYGTQFTPRLRGLIEQMSDEAARLFKYAIDAYIDGDAGLAAALDDIDDRLDELNSRTVQAVFEEYEGGEGSSLQVSVQLALICRYYERIGDHAVNMGERVRYMVDGWLPEHTGAARAAVRAQSEAEPEE